MCHEKCRTFQMGSWETSEHPINATDDWDRKSLFHLRDYSILFWRDTKNRLSAQQWWGNLWGDLGDVDDCGCTSAVEGSPIFQVKCKWLRGFKTAAECNAFPLMTSNSLKARSVRFIPSSKFHYQQSDEDDCGRTCVVNQHFHISK